MTMAVTEKRGEATDRRLRICVRGTVQGVGFRPFVYRLAREMGLAGWVNNSPQGVFIEVEGGNDRLNEFVARLRDERPPRSFIQSLESTILDTAGFEGFEIRESLKEGGRTALVLPDTGICDECLDEIFDPANRRYRYPFTNCTNCGPRFSIIESLPYDRANTTMRGFRMCELCEAEYLDPLDRRFHAQPNACPECGPRLELLDAAGESLMTGDEALKAAARAIRAGLIVAVKGLGGFHLMVDAASDDAVRELRRRKHREEKPFALMFQGMESLRVECEVSALEERLLASPESPIVLLGRRRGSKTAISQLVAPGNPFLGAMLPYTPLHHLLTAEVGLPVVATSGNLSDEPICIDENEAVERLSGIAHLFLVHDRPIARHVDDSIVRIVAGREMVMRRARGYAPLPVPLKSAPAVSILACGAHLKNTVALAVGDNAFISQHIGDLENRPSLEAFKGVIGSLKRLYEAAPAVAAHDLHPDYLSSSYAENSGLRTVPVQHHFAHVLSCMAENRIDGPVLGIAWDGTGLGTDGTIWGGEFLKVELSGGKYGFERFAHLRQFRLPGGDAAIRQPRRSALGLLCEIFGVEAAHTVIAGAFDAGETKTLLAMIAGKINSPLTSSAGRLFDAVASIAGLRHRVRHEGQAAMELEFLLDGHSTDEHYSFELRGDGRAPLVVDWEPMVREMIADISSGSPAWLVSSKFHNTLILAIVGAADRSRIESVVLTGGCFQNKYLLERAVGRLGDRGFKPYWHQRVPTNDGGISLGQILAASGGN